MRRRRPGCPLTERQLEILSLISHGYCNAEMAARLFVTVNTIKTLKRRAVKALDAYDVAHAVRIAFEDGLLEPSPVRRGRSGKVVTREGLTPTVVGG